MRQSIKITDENMEQLHKLFFEEWEKREHSLMTDQISIAEQITAFEREQVMIKNSYKTATSPTVKQMLEKDIDELEAKKVQLLANQETKQEEIFDIQAAMGYAKYLLEHLEELVFGGDNPIESAEFFVLLFEEPPTYQQLVERTPRLDPYFALIDDVKVGKNPFCGADGTRTRDLLRDREAL